MQKSSEKYEVFISWICIVNNISFVRMMPVYCGIMDTDRKIGRHLVVFTVYMDTDEGTTG